jgi:hypothetical protein
VPIDRLKPAEGGGGGGAMPPLTEATSILLVVDLTNAQPGAQGLVTVTELAAAR